MSAELARRIEKLENHVDTLRVADDRIDKTLSELNTTIALLNQTVENIQKREDERKTFQNRTYMFIVGSFVAAFVTWIIKGGLVA